MIMGICALYVFLEVVKRFEFPKALYNFLIITVMICNLPRAFVAE